MDPRIPKRPAGPTRRRAVAGLLGGGALAVAGDTLRSPVAAAAANPRTPAEFMALAFAMRRQAVAAGDQPYGAVVVLDGRVVAEAPSAVVTKADPTAHAETEAIRQAERRIGAAALAGAVLYSSSRPCAMCEANARRAGIARMIHGVALVDAGAPQGSP